jgi:N,N'-diacetyllegionaminate synthase
MHLPCIIAEVGSVHDGSFGNACKLIELAATCGADVVKFQTHLAEHETLPTAPAPSYFQGEPRYEYFRRTSFTPSQWAYLRDQCQEFGIQFMSSPFSLEAIDLLEDLDVNSYKVPSGEVSNLPLLEKLSELGKPVHLSSGMSSWMELDKAVSILKGKVDLTVMQCTSAYPCPAELVGLNVISEIKFRYGVDVNVGFSDHTAGIAAGPAAAALGASIIEKHLTFSRKMYGSDASNALEPSDFTLYSHLVRETWAMMSNPVNKDNLTPFLEMKHVFEKSIVTARPVLQNSIIVRDDLAFKKPGDGIPSSDYLSLIGRRANKDLPVNYKFTHDDLI